MQAFNKDKLFFPSGLGTELDSPFVQKRNLSWLVEEAKALGVSISNQQIELLKVEDLPVVLTGQQPGLLGGPAYVWYKAKTAVELAKEMSKKWGKPVLPIFWIAGDDSDVLECNHFEFSSGRSISVEPNKYKIGTSVRNLTWPESEKIRLEGEVVAESKLFESTLEPWLKNKEWVCSFAQALSKEFPELIFVDGGSPRVVERSQMFHKKSFELRNEVDALLLKQEALIEKKGLKIQVAHVDGLWRGFALEAGRRRRLGGDESLETLELTHDVLSRPLVCSELFNVNAHVLGPGEMAYFRQIEPLFSLFGFKFPSVQPRMSVEVHSQYDKRLLAEKGLNFKRLKSTPWNRLIDELVHEYFKSQMKEEVDFSLLSKSVSEYSRGFSEKLSNELSDLWDKRVNAFFKKEYKKTGEYRKLLDVYKRLGSGRPQERVLSWFEMSSLGLLKGVNNLNPLEDELQNLMVEKWN